jgi:hypothetical protein
MKSLAELMDEAFDLSLNLCYKTITPEGHYFDPRDIKDDTLGELVSGWADGLVHAHYQRLSTGRCSVSAMINFDVGEFEESVKRDIKTMQHALKSYGPPRRLTYHEMQFRGYRGSSAGYFPLLTYPGCPPYDALRQN